MFAYTDLFLWIITSATSGIQKLKYSRGLLGYSKSILMPGLSVNGKCCHSAPNFAHMPCHATIVIAIFFCQSSHSSKYDEVFTFISL
jgi:hypothetical protein